ncbi:MAG TPA: hypothetical protein VFA41_05740 [Ktedonobacteraceae bacterium]|jgi:hypothetical protein|nr:hypothetical protein [Ktedonobacteraceae bacterium]
MAERRKQVGDRGLIQIVDEIFDVFEQAKTLLQNWQPDNHACFIDLLWKLKQLEADLYLLGYDDDFVDTVKWVVYHSVFTICNSQHL